MGRWSALRKNKVTPFDINFLEISWKFDGARWETVSRNLTPSQQNLGYSPSQGTPTQGKKRCVEPRFLFSY